jgi:acetylornithine deacetylase
MNSPSVTDILAVVESVRDETERFLCDLIRIPSLPGKEAAAIEEAAQWFREIAEVEAIPLSNSLREDRDYSNPIPMLEYDNRFNLRIHVPGRGHGRKLLLNTHLDVVPPSDGQDRPFEPRLDSGFIHGRGACDAKGQVAVIFAALSALRRMGLPFHGDVVVHLVVEEEVGGNGTLAMIRYGEQADGCLVMEPTSLRILSSVRGAVWFRIMCAGRPGHSGRSQETVSALKSAVGVMETLEQYHARLLASSRGIPLFDCYPDPMPITFGKLTAGDWPSTAPARAVVEGVLGFLPNKNAEQVMKEIRQAIMDTGDIWLREHFKLDFTYRHDAHSLHADHPLIVGLQSCCRDFGVPGEVNAMTASCDSWYYNNQLRIPTVVFGAGDLSFAHSCEEKIHLDEVLRSAAILVRFVQRWCEDDN